MSLEHAKLGNLSVSRLLIGGNPFSGFSHQTAERSAEMRAYYTQERIHATLRQAESLGINTFLGRAVSDCPASAPRRLCVRRVLYAR